MHTYVHIFWTPLIQDTFRTNDTVELNRVKDIISHLQNKYEFYESRWSRFTPFKLFYGPIHVKPGKKNIFIEDPTYVKLM